MIDSVQLPRHGGNLSWAASLAGCDRSQILDFSASINPLGFPKSVMVMLKSTQVSNWIQNYPDPNYAELRAAIANYHQISPDWIFPGNGAAELLTWAGRDFASLGAVSLIVPAFSDYLRALNLFDITIDKFTSLQEILDRSADSTTGLLLNNPHNPTGKLYSRGELQELLEKFALVVVDEAFMDFLPPEESESLIELVDRYENLVILRSLTKFYALPGLRIGYAISNPQRLKTWQTWRDPWSVNCFAEQAAIICLQDREFQQSTLDWLPPARSHLYEQLQQISWLSPTPSAANFLLVESQRSVAELQNYLLKKHRILIRHCHSFPELGDRYFRVCIKTIADHNLLLNALKAYSLLKS